MNNLTNELNDNKIPHHAHNTCDKQRRFILTSKKNAQLARWNPPTALLHSRLEYFHTILKSTNLIKDEYSIPTIKRWMLQKSILIQVQQPCEMWGHFNVMIPLGMYKTCSHLPIHWNWRKDICPLPLGMFFFKKLSFKEINTRVIFLKNQKNPFFSLSKTESWTRTHDYNLHTLWNQFNTASESSWTGNSFPSVFNHGPPLRSNLSTLWPGESRYSWSMNHSYFLSPSFFPNNNMW